MTKRSILPWVIFLFIFAGEFALGFYISYVKGYMHTDALSRVANAFYVLYSRDPHLGAIGFIWNPLPSLMEMVLLIFLSDLSGTGVPRAGCRHYDVHLLRSDRFAAVQDGNPI